MQKWSEKIASLVLEYLTDELQSTKLVVCLEITKTGWNRPSHSNVDSFFFLLLHSLFFSSFVIWERGHPSCNRVVLCFSFFFISV